MLYKRIILCNRWRTGHKNQYRQVNKTLHDSTIESVDQKFIFPREGSSSLKTPCTKLINAAKFPALR